MTDSREGIKEINKLVLENMKMNKKSDGTLTILLKGIENKILLLADEIELLKEKINAKPES